MFPRPITPFGVLALAVLLAGAAAALTGGPLAAQSPTARPPVRPFDSPGTALLKAFDPVLDLRADGRLVSLAGPLPCETGETAEVHAVLTQEATAAMATGHWTGACTSGVDQRWQAPAGAVDEPRFAPGEAQACGLAVFHRDGFPVAAGQWCATVTLAP
jgi:hypothetical protein